MTETNPYAPPSPNSDVEPAIPADEKHDRPSFFTVYFGAMLGAIAGSLSFGWLFGLREHPYAPGIGLGVGVALALLLVAISRRIRMAWQRS